MQNHLVTWRASRALRLAFLALGATIGFLLLSAGPASAQVSKHESHIEMANTGAADANTGRNDLAGNTSVNSTLTVQEPEEVEGGLVNVIADETEESDGSASLETGSATAIGNASSTVAVQAAALGDGADELLTAAIGTPYGPTPASPLAVLGEAPSDESVAAESTGQEAGLEVDDEAGADEEAPDAGDLASTEATEGTEGASQSAFGLPVTGTAAANAGTPAVPALATVPLDNTVLGAVSGAGPPGLTNSEQEIEIENLGEATANTGENAVVDGDVLTGSATAHGNISESSASQALVALGDVNLVDQDIEIVSEGDADANTGRNVVEDGSAETGDATATGNIAKTTTSQFAVAVGEFNELDQDTDIEDEGDADANTGENEVVGGDVSTGAADAAGNISATSASQFAMADGEFNQLAQDIEATNDGDADADTGNNAVEDGEVATGDATATGNWSGTALGQRILTPAAEDQNFIDQALEAVNEGDALAVTGENTAVAGEDGEVVIDTGDALATGNMASTAASQESV